MLENYNIDGHISRLRRIARSYENINVNGDDMDNSNNNSKDNNQFILNDEEGVPLWSQQTQQRRKRSNRDLILDARKITQDELFEEIKYLSFFYMCDTPWLNEMAHELANFVLDEKILPRAAAEATKTRASAEVEDDFELEQYLLDSIHRAFQELPSISKDKPFNTKSNTTNAAASNNRMGSGSGSGSGLKPQLGYSSTAYEGRNFWKDSSANFGKLQSISTLYFWLKKFVDCEDNAESGDGVQGKGAKKLRQYWHVTIPAILKILDDTDGMIKVLGCRILCEVLARLSNDNSNSAANDTNENSTNNNSNYLTKSGLDQVFADSITVCFAYVPSVAGSIAKSRTILSVAYETMLQLIVKCSSAKANSTGATAKNTVAIAQASARLKVNRGRGLSDMDNQLIDLLNLHILDRVALVLSMSSVAAESQIQGQDTMMSDRIEICNIYATMVRKIVRLLSGNDDNINNNANSNKTVLVLRLTLWKFILPVLTDLFLFVGVGNGSHDALLAFLENLLRCVLELIEAAAPRVQKYQFDILAGLIIFIERFEKEICHNDAIQDLGIEFAAAGISPKISEIKSSNTQEKHQGNPSDNGGSDEVKKLLRKVVLLVLAKGGGGVEAMEIIEKKPFMREYVE